VDNKRRSSTGRSKIIEQSIDIITELSKSKSLDDIFSFSINNSLINEIRSIAWRIALGLLPVNNVNVWALNTKKQRDVYYQKSTKVVTESIVKYLRNELKSEEATKLIDKAQIELLEKLRKEIKQITELDFFKSEIITEIIIRLSFLWGNLNPEVDDYRLILSYICCLVYSLYPSILHMDLNSLNMSEDNLDNLEIQKIFYYLNNEEHFDADIFNIFDAIMNKGIKQYLVKSKTYKNVELKVVLENLSKIEDNNGLFEYTKNFSKNERILYFYLRLVNKEFVDRLLKNNVDLYKITQNIISHLLSNFVNFDCIIYYWDCIFTHDACFSLEKPLAHENNFMSFVDFVILALLTLNEGKIDNNEYEKKFAVSVLTSNPKEVIKKAVKLREKITNLFS